MVLKDHFLADSIPPKASFSPKGVVISSHHQSDTKIAVAIRWILQGGVVISTLIILTGCILLLLQPEAHSAGNIFTFPKTLSQVIRGVFALQAQAVIALGLLFLIITPVARVIIALCIFVYERDWRYTLITSGVIILLGCSLFFGGAVSDQITMNSQFVFSWSTALLLLAGSLLAGVIGSLVGLGGGTLIVPMLTLFFGLPIPFAIGASIVSVIATSSGATISLIRDRLVNIRIGSLLELATVSGAICGAFLAGLLAPGLLAILFGCILLISAAPILFQLHENAPPNVKNDRWARMLRLGGSYPDRSLKCEVSYQVTHTPLSLTVMYISGIISGLLGIGGGTFKVLGMDILMRLPIKVSTATMMLVMGVTAAASAGVHFMHGNIPPLVAAPVALGILLGARIGAYLLSRLSNKILRLLFIPVILFIAIKMILQGAGF